MFPTKKWIFVSFGVWYNSNSLTRLFSLIILIVKCPCFCTQDVHINDAIQWIQICNPYACVQRFTLNDHYNAHIEGPRPPPQWVHAPPTGNPGSATGECDKTEREASLDKNTNIFSRVLPTVPSFEVSGNKILLSG